MFIAKQAYVSEQPMRGVCGRFTRGLHDCDFERLCDEPRRVTFVAGEDMLQSVLGMSPAQAMLHLGFSLDWLHNRLKDGTRFKLFVFPSARATLATWDNLFELVREHYPKEIYTRLAPHIDALKTASYVEIDPTLRIKLLAELTVKEKFAHVEFMTEDRFAALPFPVSLFQARSFLYHALGCNLHFAGDGENAMGQQEFMMKNDKIRNVPDLLVVDLQVMEQDLLSVL